MKKSGRISAAAAFAGELLGLRPIITLIDGKTNVASKVRGGRQGDPRHGGPVQKADRRLWKIFEYMIGHTKIKQAEDLRKALQRRLSARSR